MMMRWTTVALTVGVFFAFGTAQIEAAKQEQPPMPPTARPIQGIFVPAGATLLTELQLTKSDLLPVVAQVFAYFTLQHTGGQVVLPGEDLKNLITAMDALWLVEYEVVQRDGVLSDTVKMHQSLMEAQGWQRILLNRSTKGDRETIVMIEPPRSGLFVLTVRKNDRGVRAIAVRTKGAVDVGTTLWLLMTFLMRPETPALTPPAPTSGEKKEATPTEKITPEKPPEKPSEKTPPEKTSPDESSEGKEKSS